MILGKGSFGVDARDGFASAVILVVGIAINEGLSEVTPGDQEDYFMSAAGKRNTLCRPDFPGISPGYPDLALFLKKSSNWHGQFTESDQIVLPKVAPLNTSVFSLLSLLYCDGIRAFLPARDLK